MIDRSNCPAERHGTAGKRQRLGCLCDDARDDARRLRRERSRRLATGGIRMRYFRSDDVDPVAVERAVTGDTPRMTLAERREAVARLTSAHRSAQEIAELLRIHQRTVQRYRKQLQAAA